jgi:hypothetical protein
MTEPFRCSVAAAAEPMAGSAAHDRAFLLVEHPAPWAAKALEGSRWLPEAVRVGLTDRAARAGVRIQLIRRHRTPATLETFRVFVAYADPAGPWAMATVLADPAELLDVDLEGLAAGVRPGAGWEPHERPLLLVCTNGRRDVCCAERGRPLATALDTAYPAETWETTHLGGHRFAGALLTLPTGLSYGRIDAATGPHLAALTAEGRLDTAHLRGRSAYPPAVQAAEIALLDRLGVDRVDALVLESVEEHGDRSEVAFRHGGESHVVAVTAVPGPALRQSCGDEKTKPATRFEVS